MISVCIATYNGSKYIKEQIDSILPQLDECDEIIVSDDSSTDNTLSILKSYHDRRIIIFTNQKFNSPIYNFENALKHAKGDIIFLSDQDDIWEFNKVQVMISFLQKKSLVVSDCYIINQDKNVICDSLFNGKVPNAGVFINILRNHYIGCCMAFANAQGGKFFIGIDDNGKIIGVENSKKLLESLPSKIRDAMGIVVDINLVPIYICVTNTKTV